MPVVATSTPEDAMLSFAAPLGLALAHGGAALVIDLAAGGLPYPGERTVARLIDEGPRAVDLAPQRTGVAVLPSGGADPDDAADLVDHLASGWPAVVLRTDRGMTPGWPEVPVVPLLPVVRQLPPGKVVFQDLGWGISTPGPGLRVPPPRRATWLALAAGRRPMPDRWIRSLREVWQWV